MVEGLSEVTQLQELHLANQGTALRFEPSSLRALQVCPAFVTPRQLSNPCSISKSCSDDGNDVRLSVLHCRAHCVF